MLEFFTSQPKIRHFDLPCNEPDLLKPFPFILGNSQKCWVFGSRPIQQSKTYLLFSNDGGLSQNNIFGAFVPFQAVHFQDKLQTIVHNKRASRAVLFYFIF